MEEMVEMAGMAGTVIIEFFIFFVAIIQELFSPSFS